jgi:hypothetical protein
MADFETGNGSSREELLQRVALMELMIAEGRRSTARFGWIFVLWGLVDIFGMGWQIYWPSNWVWPVTIGCGLILQFAGIALRRNKGQWCSATMKSRSISAVWSMMGLATSIYCFTGIFSHHTDGVAYVAAIFMLVGLAHAISSLILRWGVQGFVAGTWWAGGITAFFIDSYHGFLYLFVAEMFFGMVLFGLYAMWLERQGPSAPSSTPVQYHA